ncbi:MAG TPA: GH25 family lysozyme, partial [Thiobacillus sp.]
VIAKASEGTVADPKYATFAAQTLQAGKVLGAYHFGVPGPNPTAQAPTLLSVARNAQFLALDVEGKALQSPAAMRAGSGS